MYLDSLVKVPDVKGKITYRTKGNTTYVEYESGRVYIPEKKYTTVSRKTIGKLTDADRQIMQPNENFLKFFPDTDLPDRRSSVRPLPWGGQIHDSRIRASGSSSHLLWHFGGCGGTGHPAYQRLF